MLVGVGVNFLPFLGNFGPKIRQLTRSLRATPQTISLENTAAKVVR